MTGTCVIGLGSRRLLLLGVAIALAAFAVIGLAPGIAHATPTPMTGPSVKATPPRRQSRMSKSGPTARCWPRRRDKDGRLAGA